MSPWGYEMKYVALHKAGEYYDAVDAFEMMLSKMQESPDPEVQRELYRCFHVATTHSHYYTENGDQYISPSSVRAIIRKTIQKILRRFPRVLIDTVSGRLHGKAAQASAFESHPIFIELVSSMTKRIDHVRIKREVRQYFRYVMLSHTWEDNEPLFHQVIHTAVYDLEQSPTHEKLQMFCNVVRDSGFIWAWSDTCCINKVDHFVLQEALVAMFRWYQNASLVIVYLWDVRSPSLRGALMRSIWNTRGWTLQEYIAAKTIHFYTQDWTPYLHLELSNHKELLEIVSEMEQATGVSVQQLRSLRPGLTSIRDKLRLASTRETTMVEDAAYSLLGIFSVSGIPAIYGEGEGSLGRLLAHILTGSGDVSILAWMGESGSFNSCLPAHIAVFNGSATSHLPEPIPDAEMERLVVTTSHSSFDLDTAMRLYDRLNNLPTAWFAASRMRLPCLAFQLPSFSRSRRTRSGNVYRVNTRTFGVVEIKTRRDISQTKPLYLVHPWLDTLLERERKGNAAVEEDVSSLSSDRDDEKFFGQEFDDDEFYDEEIGDGEGFSDEEADDEKELEANKDEIADEEQPSGESDDEFWSLPDDELPSFPDPSITMDKQMRARRLVAYLRQPFGALLLTPASKGEQMVDYKRVAADSLITVRIRESVSLANILSNVRTLDVL